MQVWKHTDWLHSIKINTLHESILEAQYLIIMYGICQTSGENKPLVLLLKESQKRCRQTHFTQTVKALPVLLR